RTSSSRCTRLSLRSAVSLLDETVDITAATSCGSRPAAQSLSRTVAALVGAGYRVLRPQPRGIGKSFGPMADVVLDDLGDDVAHVIDQLGVGPAAVLGHAFGNVVARTV